MNAKVELSAKEVREMVKDAIGRRFPSLRIADVEPWYGGLRVELTDEAEPQPEVPEVEPTPVAAEAL